MPGAASRVLPKASVARLPAYLRAITDLSARGVATVSSVNLAQLVGAHAAQVRRDLSYLGSLGTRGSGYEVAFLEARLRAALGLNRVWRVVIVGVGNLGRALALHGGLSRRGFEVVALVDVDPAKVGETLGGVNVSPPSELSRLVSLHNVTIAVIATPAEAAQDVASALVDCGVSAILSFAPIPIGVPDHVAVRAMDVSSELQILSFHCVRQEQARLAGRG